MLQRNSLLIRYTEYKNIEDSKHQRNNWVQVIRYVKLLDDTTMAIVKKDSKQNTYMRKEKFKFTNCFL